MATQTFNKVEQSSQTGGSLGCISDAKCYCNDDTICSVHAPHFRLASDSPTGATSTPKVTYRSDCKGGDYDDVVSNSLFGSVAACTDNSSLHFHMESIERQAKLEMAHSADAERMRFWDALPQVWAALIANLLPMQAGINMAYSAILLPQLSDPLADIPINKDEASWFASLVTISLPIGSLAIGPLIDRYGRKRVSVLSTLPFFVGWLLVSCARNIYMLYAARVMCGMAGGLSTVSIIYVSEIADARLRPALLGLNSVYVSLGILVTCVLGMFFEWRRIAVIYMLMTAASALLLCLLPESPRWLCTFRPDEVTSAKDALRWLYRRQELYAANWKRLQQSTTMSSTTAPQLQPMLSTSGGKHRIAVEPVAEQHWSHIYRQPHVYKPLGILLMMFVFQQLSGAYVIIFYAINLFLKIGGHFGEGINEYGALLLLGTIRFVMSIVAALLSHKVGRRKLMFISGLGMAVCTLLAGLYMHYEQLLVDYYARTENPADDIDPERYGNKAVLLGCVLGYVSFCALGVMVIPWILIGEVLPTQVKGTLGGFVMAAAYVLMFGAVKVFPYAMDRLGAQGLFYVFSTTSFLGVVYVFVYLPETLGRSFEEIERRFRPSSVNRI